MMYELARAALEAMFCVGGDASSGPHPHLGQAHLSIPHDSGISLMSGQKTRPRRLLKLGRPTAFFGSQREEIVPSK